MPKRSKKEMKSARWEDFQEAALKYNKCLFVTVDNVNSKQICVVRKRLRNIGGKMIMGKKTHLRAALLDITQEPDPRKDGVRYEERKARWAPRPHLNIVRDQFNGNCGFIFTNRDLSETKAILDTRVRAAPAKVGALAPRMSLCPLDPQAWTRNRPSSSRPSTFRPKLSELGLKLSTPSLLSLPAI